MCISKPSSAAIPLFLLLLSCLCASLCYGKHIPSYFRNSSGSCHANERKALLHFKQGLRGSTGMLSSWRGEDCCNWRGVRCNKLTGNIIKLDVRCPGITSFYSYTACFEGEFNPSLLNLEFLEYLDISGNNFPSSDIPKLVGSFQKLKHLDLSFTRFAGHMPGHLGNLTGLVYLNISHAHMPLKDGSWFSNLVSLKYLDVAHIDFEDNNIELDNLTSLQHLDLSFIDFTRTIPMELELGNLTSLRHLDIGSSEYLIRNNEWLSHLTYLTYLDISYCVLEDNKTSIFQSLNMLPVISQVHLECSLQGRGWGSFSPGAHLNFTFLTSLDISSNFLNSSIPDWLYNTTSLQQLRASRNSLKGGISSLLGRLCKLNTLDVSENCFVENSSEHQTSLNNCSTYDLQLLDISNNQFSGFLPDWLSKHQKLKYLHLANNEIYGSIPESLGKLTLLQEFRMSNNRISGNIPSSIWKLTELTTFEVAFNNLQGILSELHFSKLKKLEYLDLSSNSLELNMSNSWVPPFQLKTLALKSCKLGPHFPRWLRWQHELMKLHLDYTGISGSLPLWIWNFSSKLFTVSMSNNNLSGIIPSNISHDYLLIYVNLSSNSFEGSLPLLKSSSIEYLDMSNNSFSGLLREFMQQSTMPGLNVLSLSSNGLTGDIPSYICKWRNLNVLDMSTNHLTGALPKCLKRLSFLNLARNYISSSGFTSVASTCSLESLHLNQNNLSGAFLLSLQKCSELRVLDLGENKITGVIPEWLVDSLPNIQVFRLHSNCISGVIPFNLPQMSYLQIIDLANNNLSGRIPKNFGNFSSMKHARGSGITLEYGASGTMGRSGYDATVVEFTSLIVKGQDLLYKSLLPLVNSIDLSRNNLCENIPVELGSLISLINLNLSNNYLTGTIPKEFSKLELLESLDLSNNKISGQIPDSLSTMTSLSHLNLSFNNLSGSIPTKNQFSTFTENSIYIGNSYLCGFPLQKCEHESRNNNVVIMQEINNEPKWFWMGMAIGFIVGFWIFCGTLIMNTSWRLAYYKLMHDVVTFMS